MYRLRFGPDSAGGGLGEERSSTAKGILLSTHNRSCMNSSHSLLLNVQIIWQPGGIRPRLKNQNSVSRELKICWSSRLLYQSESRTVDLLLVAYADRVAHGELNQA